MIYGDGTVTFTDCNIYENTATNVRAPQICPSPRWIAADGPCVLYRVGESEFTVPQSLSPTATSTGTLPPPM